MAIPPNGVRMRLAIDDPVYLAMAVVHWSEQFFMELPRRTRGDELLKPGELLSLRRRLRRYTGGDPDDAAHRRLGGAAHVRQDRTPEPSANQSYPHAFVDVRFSTGKGRLVHLPVAS